MLSKNFLKQNESLILYFALFFPAVFSGKTLNISFFTSLEPLIIYIIVSVPQIFLIIYFIEKNQDIKSYCNKNTIFLIFLYTIALLVISNIATYILIKTSIITPPSAIETNINLIPVYLFVSIVTGYREELFFRLYLTNSLKSKRIITIIIISIMFSICHITQGSAGIIISFLNSIALCLIFLKHRNIHINAFSHALYNFTILVITAFPKSSI